MPGVVGNMLWAETTQNRRARYILAQVDLSDYLLDGAAARRAHIDLAGQIGRDRV